MHGYVLMQKVAEMGREEGRQRRGLGGKEPSARSPLLGFGAGRVPNSGPGPIAPHEGALGWKQKHRGQESLMCPQRPGPRSLQGSFRELS